MNTDKSHVGMDLCFFCNEPKGIVLDARLRNSLPRAAVYNHVPCDKCIGYMKQGVILISVSEELTVDKNNPYRTGGWVVAIDDAIERWFADFDQTIVAAMLEKRVGFVTDELWDAIGIPRGEIKEGN